MRRAILLGVTLLAGCGLAQRQAALEQLHTEVNNCQVHRNGGNRPQTPYTRCVTQAQEAAHIKGAPRDLDVIRLTNARRMVAAERYDNGRMTRAEFEAAMVELDAVVASTSRARDQGQQAASAAMMAQGAAIMATPAPAMAPLPAPPMTRDVRCTTTGNVTNCQQW